MKKTRYFRILIVDDNLSFRKAFRLKLNDLLSERIRYIEEATNGEEAIEMVKNRKFDIIFMDINMPVMNGIEASRYITREFRDNFIVALSMYNDFHFLEEMLCSGATTYIQKDELSDDMLEYAFSLFERHQNPAINLSVLENLSNTPKMDPGNNENPDNKS